MLKLSKLLSFVLLSVILSVISSVASASLITGELTNTDNQKTYISYAGLDWTWAAKVNNQFYDCDDPIANPENYVNTVLDNSDCTNQLLAPTYRDGWRYLTTNELDTLINTLTITAFLDVTTQTFIQSVAYWNTEHTNVDYNDFIAGEVASSWVSESSANRFYDTFYVRASQSQAIPEPSVLLLFSFVLITLFMRNKQS